MKNIRFFRYSGAKFNYVDEVNPFFNATNKKVYVEPFVGSGAILFNLEKKFDKYIINDFDKNIILMYNTFKVIEFKEYLEKIQFIEKRFGDIKNSKESYYAFRSYFNEEFYGTNSQDEGIFLHVLANSCINSMLRFGPNGMNQSYGGRFYKLEKEAFNLIQERLKNTVIHNEDFREIIERYKDEGVFFLDPPYFSQGSSYKDFSEADIKDLLDSLSNIEYVYTDILNEYNSVLTNGKFLRDMRNTAPSSSKEKRGNLEYLFTDIPPKVKSDEWF